MDIFEKITRAWPEPPNKDPVRRLHHTADVFRLAGDHDPDHLVVQATGSVYGIGVHTGLTADDLVTLSALLKSPEALLDLLRQAIKEES
jgi:hypothetical protein